MKTITTRRATAAAGVVAILLSTAAVPAKDVQGFVQCSNVTPAVASVQTAKLAADAPAGSVQAGNGCGSADGIHFAGSLDAGAIDGMTIELHWLGAGSERGNQPFNLSGTVSIDGNAIPIKATVPTIAENNSYGAPVTYLVKFTLVGFGAKLDPKAKSHDIDVKLSFPGTGASPWSGPGLWAWGTTEVPTGVTLHATAPTTGTIVKVS